MGKSSGRTLIGNLLLYLVLSSILCSCNFNSKGSSRRVVEGDTVYFENIRRSESDTLFSTLASRIRLNTKFAYSIADSRGRFITWKEWSANHIEFYIEYKHGSVNKVLNTFWYHDTSNYSYDPVPIVSVDSIYKGKDLVLAYVRYPFMPYFSRHLDLKFLDSSNEVIDSILLKPKSMNSFFYFPIPSSTFTIVCNSLYSGNNGNKTIEIHSRVKIDSVKTTSILDTASFIYGVDTIPLWR